MLSREDFYMIKQMRQQGDIVDIATQVGCSERTVRRYRQSGTSGQKNTPQNGQTQAVHGLYRHASG